MEELTQDMANQYLAMTDETFNNRDAWSELGINDVDGKAYWRVIIHRWIAQGKIEPTGKPGTYRKKDSVLREMDWENADAPELPILWPLDLHKYVEVFPRSIVIVAGSSNAGKSAFCLQFAYLNMIHGEKLKYYNSESGVQQFKRRLEPLNLPIPPPFKVYRRDGRFQDVIDPCGFSVIDYLEVPAEAYTLATEVDCLWRKLEDGLVVIALQKPPGRDDAFGGFMLRSRAQLYLSLDYDRLKVVKAKTPRDPKNNPNGWMWKFRLEQGVFFKDIERVYA